MRLDRLDHREHCVNEDANLIEIEPGSQPVLGELACCFVFERQSDTTMASSDRRAAINSAADAPVGLRIAAWCRR